MMLPLEAIRDIPVKTQSASLTSKHSNAMHLGVPRKVTVYAAFF